MLECKKIDVDISKLPVSLSEKAVQIIEKALKSKDWDRKALRISVEGGGCQGFKYGLNLTQDFDDNDVFCQYSRSINIVIDINTYTCIKNTFIDFVNTSKKSGFVFKNPNSMTACNGCN